MTELPKDHAMIVKIINVVGRTKHGNDTIGFIIYERSFSDSYVMKKDPETDPIKRLLSKKKEELFPVDELDNLLLDAVKSKFPESFVKSHLIIEGLGKNNYEHILSHPKERSVFIIEPDFAGVDKNALAGRSFDHYHAEVNIYQNYSLEHITGHYFKTVCNLDRHQTIVEQLCKIAFL